MQCRGTDQPCVVSKGIQPSYGMSKLAAHKMTQLRVFTRNGGKVTDLLEYQHKKEQKEKRIARQDELV